MSHYLVFSGRKWQNTFGKQGITWEVAGVFGLSESGDEGAQKACLIGAQKAGVGTCVAIEVFAWGVDLVDAGSVSEIGVELDAIARLERMGEKMLERMSTALPAAQQRELNPGDDNGE